VIGQAEIDRWLADNTLEKVAARYGLAIEEHGRGTFAGS
jgi:hypothetical protein